jgi:hypothetical protein
MVDFSSFVCSKHMRKEKLHIATIVIGITLALAITFSQYLTPDAICSVEKVKIEQTDKSTGDEKASFISLPSFSIPAPVSVEVNLDAYCLFEIFFEEDIDENYTEEDDTYADRFFQTMFRVIISPNAP